VDKVVLDTNVFVSAYLKPNRISVKVVDLWILGVFQLVVCEEILDEYSEILLRKGISYNLVKELNKQIWNTAIKIKIHKRLNLVKDDPDDDKFIECALEGKANIIVSGDPHLLKLEVFRGIKILTPKEYLELLIKK